MKSTRENRTDRQAFVNAVVQAYKAGQADATADDEPEAYRRSPRSVGEERGRTNEHAPWTRGYRQASEDGHVLLGK